MTGTPLFDAAADPLQKGVNMIEASAGTGKTFTIAMLVLRLVAEYGLKIDEILLVTFTRAATQELGNRIRTRLLDARDFLDGTRGGEDETLQRWSEKLAEKQTVQQRIADALLDIDRASIFTIHGFCQRMLQDLVMESGEVFDLELLADGDEIRRRIADDFWRKKIYPLSRRQSGMILAQFASPEKLYASVAPVPLRFHRLEPEFGDLAESQFSFERSFEALASWWRINAQALYTGLESLVQAGKMKKGFTEDYDRWYQNVTEYLLGSGTVFPAQLQWLQQQGLTEQINGSKVRGGAAQQELIESLFLPDSEACSFVEDCRRLMLHIRVELLKTLSVESQRWLRRQSAITYDELILRLHQAVTSGDGSMARNLRQRFAAVLIDEFQDTDALQWQIFGSVFGHGSYCYLIGDPKQAIYRFRGADIHSYFKARKAADSLYTLGNNFRSHPGVVGGINALFQARPKPFAFEEDILAFQPVRPAKTAEDGMLLDQDHDQGSANMVYCQLPRCGDSQNGRWSSSVAAAAVMRLTTEEIVRLLNDPAEVWRKKKKLPLQPNDIAILVRTNRQAEEYQQSLVEAGVPAVVSSRLSVYLTEECRHLLLLLEAMARPEELDVLKQALTLPWFGLTGDELYRIYSDEAEMSAWHERFQNYAGTWRERGVLAMLSHLIDGESIYAGIAARGRGERIIANMEHLLELLQQAESDNGYGPLQLIQWLQRRLEKGEKEEELRLESDDEAVRIVTMHGAKGLEFPVVFCPLLWYRQMRLETERLRVASQEDGGMVIDLGSEEFERRRQQALIDEMAEELRLAYVALTRSQLRCYVVWCDVAGRRGGSADSFDSSLGYLLFPEGPTSFAGQQQRLQELACGTEVVHRLCADSGAVTPYRGVVVGDPCIYRLRESRRLPLKAASQMTSYSALVAGDIHSSTVTERKPFSSADAETTDFAELPSGASFGSAVHDMLEEISFAELLRPHQHRSMLHATCNAYGLEPDMTLLESMLQTVVSAPIGRCVKARFTLADLDEKRCIKEMGFYFHLAGGETGNLNAILAGEESVCPIAERELAGFLTGFVDLVFEYEGVYYIADYKTNNLGPYLGDYRGTSLVEAMAQHNYGLQLWLYALVLHRHLANFLPGYDHGRHFGGIFYLFVRGMGKGPAGIYYRKPDLDTLERLGRCFGGKN